MTPELQQKAHELYALYSEAISDDRLEDWPDLFVDDCQYRLISRQNHDRGLPLATILCESRGALVDRVTAIRNTMVFQPRRVAHTFSNLRIVSGEGDELTARSMFCVWQTLTDGQTRLQMVGRSFDRLVRDGDSLKFLERLAVFDSELVPGSIVYPV